MKTTRRTFCIAIGVGFTSACATSPTAPSPTASVPLLPLDRVVSQNGSTAILRYSGRARGNQKLLEAIRDAGYNLRLRTNGYGAGRWEINPAEFGWIFCVQNRPLALDAGNATLNPNDLWAAYEKQSLG